MPPRLGTIDFNRDIQPILSENCYHCHGPDAHARKANLRLDRQEGAFGKKRRWPRHRRPRQTRRQRTDLAHLQHRQGRGDADAEVEPHA
ncbi:MAG: c-type cytochrome domain-containing protein [Chthoniobacter sp.]